MSVLKQPEFSYLVKELRQRIGLTQEELAVKVGVSYTSLNRWENRKTMPVPLVQKRIEEILREMGEQGKDLLERYFLERQ